MLSLILEFSILYERDTLIELVSSWPLTSKLFTITFEKSKSKSLCIFSFKKFKFPLLICSNIKALNPPPNLGFKGLSPGLVKK